MQLLIITRDFDQSELNAEKAFFRKVVTLNMTSRITQVLVTSVQWCKPTLFSLPLNYQGSAHIQKPDIFSLCSLRFNKEAIYFNW